MRPGKAAIGPWVRKKGGGAWLSGVCRGQGQRVREGRGEDAEEITVSPGPSNIFNSLGLGDDGKFLSWQEPWSLLHLDSIFSLLLGSCRTCTGEQAQPATSLHLPVGVD